MKKDKKKLIRSVEEGWIYSALAAKKVQKIKGRPYSCFEPIYWRLNGKHAKSKTLAPGRLFEEEGFHLLLIARNIRFVIYFLFQALCKNVRV